MIARYHELRTRPRLFLSLTGLRVAEFDRLVPTMLPCLVASERAHRPTIRLPDGTTRPRRRAAGAGHPFRLSRCDQLLLVVVWLRIYPTNELLGYLFGVSDSTASRLIRRLVPLLAEAGQDTMRLPDPGRKHRRQLADVLSALPELAVVIDSFEQAVQRPQARTAADPWYSGKKKRHTIKSQLSVNRQTGEIVDVAESVRGPTADITLLKASGGLARLPPGVGAEGDLAYVGLDKLHPQGLGHTPRRKPRGPDKHRPRGQVHEQSAADQAYNRAFAQSRIIVEQTIGRVRRYQALAQADRHHRTRHTERVRAVAGLVNRQLSERQPYLMH